MGECASGKAAALVQGETAVLSGLNGACVVCGVHNDCDSVVVLSSCTNHGGAANVNLLDDGVLTGTGCDGLNEGVQVHDDQVERLDIQLAEGVDVLLLAAVSQNTCVDARVQGLHAAFEAFGEAGHFGDLGDGYACCRDGCCGRTGGNQRNASLVQAAGELLQTGLVVDGNEGAAQGHAIELNKRHKYSDALDVHAGSRRHSWWMDVAYPRRRAGYAWGYSPPLCTGSSRVRGCHNGTCMGGGV